MRQVSKLERSKKSRISINAACVEKNRICAAALTYFFGFDKNDPAIQDGTTVQTPKDIIVTACVSGSVIPQDQILIRFDRKLLADKGLDPVTVFLLTNSDEYPDAAFKMGMQAQAGKTEVLHF